MIKRRSANHSWRPSSKASAKEIICGQNCWTYVGKTGRQFATRMKEHSSLVRPQDDNSLLVLHCLTTGHAFDWTRASAFGKGSTKRTREFIEAWDATQTCVNQCTTINPCYKALLEYWKRKSMQLQAICHPPQFSIYCLLDTPSYAVIYLIPSIVP